jgi:hypothetical protein
LYAKAQVSGKEVEVPLIRLTKDELKHPHLEFDRRSSQLKHRAIGFFELFAHTIF